MNLERGQETSANGSQTTTNDDKRWNITKSHDENATHDGGNHHGKDGGQEVNTAHGRTDIADSLKVDGEIVGRREQVGKEQGDAETTAPDDRLSHHAKRNHGLVAGSVFDDEKDENGGPKTTEEADDGGR